VNSLNESIPFWIRSSTDIAFVVVENNLQCMDCVEKSQVEKIKIRTLRRLAWDRNIKTNIGSIIHEIKLIFLSVR
jgi:hypothetical protein